MAMVDKTFSEALTFTRATPKWVWNASGQLVEVPADQPAYDHDPVTGEPLGVLIEPTRTNLLPISETIHTDGFAKGLVVTRIGDHFEAMRDDSVNSGAAGSIRCGYLDGMSTTADTPYSFTFAVKKGAQYPHSTVRFSSQGNGFVEISEIDLDTLSSTDSRVTEVKDIGDGWVKVTLTREYSGADNPSYFNRFLLLPASGSANGDTFLFKMCQVEQGTFPTSYIPTSGAAVTRSLDRCNRALGEEHNRKEGTVVVEFTWPLVSNHNTGHLLTFFGGGLRCLHPEGSSLRLEAVDMPETAIDVGGVPGDLTRAAMSYNGNLSLWRMAGNGIAQQTEFDIGSEAYPSHLLIGEFGYGSRQYTGHVKFVHYYPYAMTAAELEALTTL